VAPRITIRPGSSLDLPAVFALDRESATAPHWPLAEYQAMVEEVAAHAEPRSRCLLVAETEAGGAAGFAVAAVAAGEAELESVVVSRALRRQGIGRRLCETAIQWAQQAGAQALLLEVRASSEAAIGLYRSLGFCAVGRRPNYYSAPADDAILMRRALAGRAGEPGAKAKV
jgi:ribosomal-protein-alanine N-acetyltransferase